MSILDQVVRLELVMSGVFYFPAGKTPESYHQLFCLFFPLLILTALTEFSPEYHLLHILFNKKK